MLEIRLIMRATHMLAAATWVGGNVFYLVVVVPALKSGGSAPALAARVAELFKRMVNICVGVLLLSGGYLVFDRLTQTTLGLPYLVVLGLKIAAALSCLSWLHIWRKAIFVAWQSARRAFLRLLHS